jgi:hypothetical protein
MFRARSLFIAVLATCFLAALASAQETERVHKVVPLGPGGTLKLNNFSGDIRITGADVSQVTIDATRRADRDRLDHIKLDVEAGGNTVTIDANKKSSDWEHRNNNVVETEFEIQVPRQVTLDVNAFSSTVRVSGLVGPQRLHTFSGRIEVQQAPAKVHAKTFSGPVDLQFAPDAGEPDVNVETFSGRIDLRLPDSVRGKLEFNTFSGDLRSDLPVTLQRQSRHEEAAPYLRLAWRSCAMKETLAGRSQAGADGSHGSHAGHDHHPHALDGDASELRERQRDPVCGMLVDPRTAPFSCHRRTHRCRPGSGPRHRYGHER